MKPCICIAPTHLLRNVRLGGHAWVFLNWALGLQDLGCRLILLEKLQWRDSPADLLGHLRSFKARLAAVGLGSARIAPMLDGELSARLGPVRDEFDALTIPVAQAAAEADLLLNFKYSVPQDVIDGFARSTLCDIDPGLLQVWMQQGTVRPAHHRHYLTIGETVGRPDARFPSTGVPWQHIAPPVHLPSWPVTTAPDDAAYTTVTNWWGEYEMIGGESVNNEKRTEFLEYIGLPAPDLPHLELAIYHEDGQASDMPLLRQHGWRARPAYEVSSTPYMYRSYIQGSRGEFSCAKRSCMVLENAWISDRTICYLASGKPAIVQHTGASRFLPDDSGLLRFRSQQEARTCLLEAQAHYIEHCQAARALVERHFDAKIVLANLLDRLLSTPEGR